MADEIKFNFLNIPNIPIHVAQGATYYNRWELQYLGEAFPFFDESNELLWDASFGIRDTFLTSPRESEPYILGEYIEGIEEGLSGIFIEQETVDEVVHTYYGLYILAEDTANLPTGKLWYNVKIKRTSDDWTIRVQEGVCNVTPDIKAVEA